MREPPHYDALQVIEYEIVGGGEHRRPDPRGLLQLLAAGHLLRQGTADTVIIAGVHYATARGDGRVSTIHAQVLRQRLRRYELRDITVIAEAEVLPPSRIEQGSKDTGGDVAFLLQQARKHAWHRVLVLGIADHLPRIQRLLAAHGIAPAMRGTRVGSQTLAVDLLSAESVLANYHPNFRWRFSASPFQRRARKRFVRAERLKQMVMTLDRKGRLLSLIAHAIPQRLKERLQS